VLYQTLGIPWKKENGSKKTQAQVTIPVKKKQYYMNAAPEMVFC
jgi:hypothetical protein